MSAWYEDFAPVADADVLRVLGRQSSSHLPATDSGEGEADPDGERAVAIGLGPDPTCVSIAGDLGLPDDSHREPRGLVILAHGGGSSRQSYRNRYLAGRLRLAGWATLRLDLLLEHESATDAESGALRFDVPLIAGRLLAAVDWAARERIDGAGRIILFGASTGAAAALLAAADRPALVAGVVARGGRVDLAAEAFSRLRAPALMVVGGADGDTLRQNRAAVAALGSRARLRVIRGAGHTFEEPGALGAVGEHVVRWLDRLPGGARPSRWWAD